MYRALTKIFFLFPPEISHDLALAFLKITNIFRLTKPNPIQSSSRTLMGLHFPNPIGLAAGLDKNGDSISALASLGFGFIEIGTVTPKPQPGNPKPRLFRLTKQEAIINRMGFNNKGVDYLIDSVKKAKFKGILGINIGKNRDTSLENAIDDYLYSFTRVYPYASYITINISSPNTASLRDLQHGELLRNLLQALKKSQTELASTHQKYVPLVVKISPDLTQSELHALAEILLEEKVDGVIATNTTISRDGIEDSSYANEQGGLSGKPLASLSTQTVKTLHAVLQNQIPIIACGGISTTNDIQEKLSAGASLVQIYTGLIYHGPKLVRELL